MDVELRIEQQNKAKPGDIIIFDTGTIGLVIQYEVILLKHGGGGDDWMVKSYGGFDSDFKTGHYKILARANEWKIVRK